MTINLSSSMKKIQGVYAVEFAIVGSLFFLIFFACLEVARLLYTWNVLTEVSRRGARLGVVCNLLSDTTNPLSSLEDPLGVRQLATFNGLNLVPNLTATNLRITYHGLNGTAVSQLSNVRLVRAEVINYQHQLIIPGAYLTLNSPTFTTTLVSESLGAVPSGDYTTCVPPAP